MTLPPWLDAALSRAPSPEPLEQVAEERFVPVDGGAVRLLHHRPERPLGRRPVVFLPGFGAPVPPWQACYAMLQDRVELVVLETLEKSTTRRPPPPRQLDPAGLARQTLAALESLQLDDYVLAGASWGATTVLETLATGGARPSLAMVYDPMVRLWLPGWLRPLVHLLPVGLTGAMRRPLGAMILAGIRQPHQHARLAGWIDAADAELWLAAVRQSLDYDLMARLPQVDAEVLVVSGTEDEVHGNDVLPGVAAALSAGRWLKLPVPDERREALVGVVLEELASVRRGEALPTHLREAEADPGLSGAPPEPPSTPPA